MTETDQLGLPAHAFDKPDAGEDLGFYAPARLVTHIDEATVEALRAFYRIQLPAGAHILDLMSSWVSHLPTDVSYAAVVGHGMNVDELGTDPQLDRWFVRDLNNDPTLPEPDASFDAVLICVVVQYLQRPLAVFRQIRRILKPGGSAIVSFSNRCFPTKAVAVWRARRQGPCGARPAIFRESGVSRGRGRDAKGWSIQRPADRGHGVCLISRS